MLRRYANWGSALVASVATILLGGCATPGDPYSAAPARTQLSADDAQGRCLRRLQAMDARVDGAGVRDAQAQRVNGFPFLRTDRYTVLSAPAGSDARALAQAKIERMAALDAEARRYEAANMRADADEIAAIDRCRDQLLVAARPQAESAVERAHPPAAYDDALRVFGLYPLTRIPFSWSAAAWQQTTRDIYATPFPELPLNGMRVRYVPGDPVAGQGVAGWLPMSPQAISVLRQPALPADRVWQLVRQHAPVVVVETADDDDQIGTLAWRMSGGDLLVAVETGTPSAYVRIAWTEINGAAVPQLVYTFWFAARPASHPLDWVAGRLDAIVWRVTLDSAGRPLLYDSIHACGCFHMFFPTENVRERPGPFEHESALDETMFSPQAVRSPAPAERIIVYVGAHDHNIERVAVDTATPAPGVVYSLLDENRLRALPLPAAAGGGTRSIYGPDGLVPGSERTERFVYWPMGVPSAGQMRQWGHHATAFVGRRHFDDPRLIDRYFTLAPSID